MSSAFPFQLLSMGITDFVVLSLVAEKLPQVSVPKLKTFDSLPKLRTYNILDRLTCNLFQSSQFSNRSTTKTPGNVLERRTVDSAHISTISSLVDRTRRDSSLQMHESQKENFGLYALKYNRSVASQRGSALGILSTNVRSPQRKFSAHSSGSAGAGDCIHEHFQPCQTGRDYGANSVPNERNGNEYYKIQFDGDECSKGSNGLAPTKTNKNCRNIKIQQIESDTNRQTVRAPTPPKRVKNLPSARPRADRSAKAKAKIEFLDDEMNHNESIQPLEESAAHQTTRAKCAIVTQQQQMRSPRVQEIKSNMCTSSITTQNQFVPTPRLMKNKSELYRIADSGKCLRKNAGDGDDDSANGNGKSMGHSTSARRKLVRQCGSSSTESHDIFATTNGAFAFNDFDKAIQTAPKVPVDGGRSRTTRECSNRMVSETETISKLHKRVTLRGIKINSESTESLGYGERNTGETINVSTDSNEIRIYSHQQIDTDSDDGITV